MSGSPPQIETIGASHSLAAPRQSSRDITSLRLVEYSRMRPQLVHVKLQVWSGSSCSTTANLGVRSSLCFTMCRANFAVSASGNRIMLICLCYLTGTTCVWNLGGRLVWRVLILNKTWQEK